MFSVVFSLHPHCQCPHFPGKNCPHLVFFPHLRISQFFFCSALVLAITSHLSTTPHFVVVGICVCSLCVATGRHLINCLVMKVRTFSDIALLTTPVMSVHHPYQVLYSKPQPKATSKIAAADRLVGLIILPYGGQRGRDAATMLNRSKNPANAASSAQQWSTHRCEPGLINSTNADGIFLETRLPSVGCSRSSAVRKLLYSMYIGTYMMHPGQQPSVPAPIRLLRLC